MYKLTLAICFSLLAIQDGNAQQAVKKAPHSKAAARKVQYLYQANGGFTAFFSDGTYYRRAGEAPVEEINDGFKGVKPFGNYKVQQDGLKEDEEELLPFKTEAGELDYGWEILNYKKVPKAY